MVATTRAELPAKESLAHWEYATDNDLVVVFQAGDERAFNELYRRYNNKFLRFFNKFAPKCDAEELTAKTWERILGGIPRFNTRHQFAAWTFAIRRNLMINASTRIPNEVSFDTNGRLPEEWFRSDTRSDPLHQTEIGEHLERLRQYADRYKVGAEAAWLRAEGYTLKEIAEKLDVPIGTVKTRIHYFRKHAREALA